MSDLEVEELMLKPYPAYKDSGVEWLGQVPEHWEVRRLKRVLRERDARSADGSEQLLRVSQFTGVTERKSPDRADGPDTRAESLVGYKHVEPGDLVVNIMLAWNGSMGVSPFLGIASPAYCVYRFGPAAEPWFFHYLLRSSLYRARIKTSSRGVVESRLRLYTDDLYRLRALFPPLPEQAAIVRYLDYMDRRIRRYIRAKQKLIKLLEEQKQVIIHEAVTGQIDVRTGKPYPAYRDSGVEWFGEVPEHWATRRLKQCASRFYSGGTPDSGTSSFYCDPGSGIPWLLIGDITRQRRVRNAVRAITEKGRESRGLDVLPAGTLLYSMYASLGSVSILEIDATVNQAIIGIRLRSSVLNTEFALYYLETLRPHVIRLASTSTQANLNAEKVRSLPVLVPTLTEQVAIVRYLDDATANTDSAIAHARREIDLLREYRTRLIADVVIGKLDVREAAASLPDEAEEPELLAEEDVLTDESEAGESAEDEAALEDLEEVEA